MEYHGLVEDSNVEKKVKGKQYHLFYYIKAVGRISSGENGKGTGEENKDFKNNGGGEEYKILGNFIHPCIKHNKLRVKVNNMLKKKCLKPK